MTRARAVLIGAPNSGKTTLYNWLTGLRHKTVNYPGSTVEYSRGVTLEIYGEPRWSVIDTPGTYSLEAKSPDEEVTQAVLFDHAELKAPDLVIAVVDATLMNRQLLLVQQLREAGFRLVVVLTKLDLVRARRQELDLSLAQSLLDCAVVGVDGRLGGGVKELVAKLGQVPRLRPSDLLVRPTSWSEERLMAAFSDIDKICLKVVRPVVTSPSSGQRVPAYGRDMVSLTYRIDRFALHPVFGLILLFALMTGFFSSLFWLAKPLMDLTNDLFTHLAQAVLVFFPQGLFANFLADGVIKGLGAVMVFVPQIAILFIGITFLEDSGYLARAATLVDRPLAKLGLNGRSFVPILSAYACAIPAMLAARGISNRRERWLTLFIIPLMTCSARLPVYALLLTLLLHDQPAWLMGLCLAALYFASLFIGGLAALFASRFLASADQSLFMLELPLYSLPRWPKLWRSVWERTSSYVRRAGFTILIFSVLLWVMTSFPNYREANESLRLQSSYAAVLGHWLEPLMRPMGLDWRVGVGLIAAFAAREVFVSALAIVFSFSSALAQYEGGAGPGILATDLRGVLRSDGSPLFSPASILGLIVFFMIALQCMSTVSVAHRESGSWRFALVQLLAFNFAAYLLAASVFQILHALS